MEINFHKILKEVMVKRGVNQLQLSQLLGVRQSQVSNWLNKKSLPGYHSIKMLCEKLGVTANYLLETE